METQTEPLRVQRPGVGRLALVVAQAGGQRGVGVLRVLPEAWLLLAGAGDPGVIAGVASKVEERTYRVDPYLPIVFGRKLHQLLNPTGRTDCELIVMLANDV